METESKPWSIFEIFGLIIGIGCVYEGVSILFGLFVGTLKVLVGQ